MTPRLDFLERARFVLLHNDSHRINVPVEGGAADVLASVIAAELAHVSA